MLNELLDTVPKLKSSKKKLGNSRFYDLPPTPTATTTPTSTVGRSSLAAPVLVESMDSRLSSSQTSYSSRSVYENTEHLDTLMGRGTDWGDELLRGVWGSNDQVMCA